MQSTSIAPCLFRAPVVAALLATPLFPAIAEEPQKPGVSETLPEIVVIGEAMRTDPQKTPVSTTFLSQDDVESFGIVVPQDIVRITPNQSATDSGSRSFGDVYSSRGLTNTVFFGAPGTTIYVDDVPFGETFTYAQNLLPVNSIETFRGPQPTLVGRNSYGGLINIRSRRPTNETEGALNYGYGSFQSQNANGYLMGAIVPDVLGFRIGAAHDSHEGYLKNTATGLGVDHQQHRGINSGLFYTPAPFWEINATISYDEYNDGAPRLTSLDRSGGFYTVSSNVAGKQERRVNNEAIRVSYDDDNVRFLSVTSHRGFALDPYTIDLDFTAAPVGYTTLTQSQELWSQEFRFENVDPNADWKWNAGLYGSGSRIQGNGLRGFGFTSSRVDFTTTKFSQVIPGLGPIPLTARSTSFSDTAGAIEQLTVHSIDESNFAAFAGVDYKGIDKWTLHGGLRFDWVQRSLTRDKTQTGQAVTETTTYTTIDAVPPFIPASTLPTDFRTTITPLGSQDARITMQDQWLHLTPTVGIDQQLGDRSMVYAKSTYAFKPGGFSAYSTDPAFVPFQQEQVWSSETGVKSAWLDEQLTTNLAGFYSSVQNYQVERSFTATNYAVFNAAKAEIYGLEFESRYALLPGLDFLGSLGYTHARLTSYTDPVTGQNLDGVTAPFVPEFDAVAALDYHMDNGLFARVDYLATGNTKFDDFNRADFQQNAYGLINASMGWRNDQWSVSVYGTNLGGEEYYTIMNTDLRTGAVGIPRIIGVKAGIQF